MRHPRAGTSRPIPGARPAPRRPLAEAGSRIGVGAVVVRLPVRLRPARRRGPRSRPPGRRRTRFLGAQARDDLLFRISSDLPSLMDTATLDYDDGDVLDQALRRRRRADLPAARPRRGHPHAELLDRPAARPVAGPPQLDLHGRHGRGPTSRSPAPPRRPCAGAPVTLSGRVERAVHGDGRRRAGERGAGRHLLGHLPDAAGRRPWRCAPSTAPATRAASAPRSRSRRAHAARARPAPST